MNVVPNLCPIKKLKKIRPYQQDSTRTEVMSRASEVSNPFRKNPKSGKSHAQKLIRTATIAIVDGLVNFLTVIFIFMFAMTANYLAKPSCGLLPK
jgi:hypothetical protein